jgi:hypothetical protein
MAEDETTHTQNAAAYRAKAAEAGETVRTVRSLKQGSEARKSQKAYTTLAENEDWLAKNDDKLVQKFDHEGRLPREAKKQ